MAIGKKISPFRQNAIADPDIANAPGSFGASWMGKLPWGKIGLVAGGGLLGAGLAGGFGGGGGGNLKDEQTEARKRVEGRIEDFEGLDTSNIYASAVNPYENMENTYEDLTVNQQQAQFQAQQSAQNRANVMQSLQGAAGGSGVAGLAQAMANQGAVDVQRASASIGLQESTQQLAAAKGAAAAQSAERYGAAMQQQMRLGGAADARNLEYQKTQGLLAVSVGRMQAANEAIEAQRNRQAANFQAIMGLGGNIAKAFTNPLSAITPGSQ